MFSYVYLYVKFYLPVAIISLKTSEDFHDDHYIGSRVLTLLSLAHKFYSAVFILEMLIKYIVFDTRVCSNMILKNMN